MLSAQAAISIENSLLYANLELRVQERTLELSRTTKNCKPPMKLWKSCHTWMP